MKYSVVESFSINSGLGRLVFPVGKLLELTDEQAVKLKGKIRVAGIPASNTTDWRPEPKAWLEGDELRVQGVFDGDWPDGGLTPEIIRLTADNLPLQKQLLRLHVGRYSGPWWERLVEVWQEKVTALAAEGKRPTEETEIRSAEVLKAVAFLGELRGGCKP